ncbi:MAG: prolyl oligopeptidase family serine peptidase [Pseudomonadales bacterium]
MTWREGGPARELTPAPFNVRSRVHEYGGGAYLPTPEQVLFVNFADQNIYRIDAAGAITAVTRSADTERFADLAWDHARARVLAVCERHRADGEPVNSLVGIDLGGQVRALHEGHDFYAAPRLSADGAQLAFIAWDHPNMPWDGTMLKVCALDAQGTAQAATLVAGGAGESVLQPLWGPADTLLFASDAGGFWNLYRYDADGLCCLHEDAAEYAQPPWTFAGAEFAALDAGHLVARRGPAQRAELVLIDTTHGFAAPLDDAWADYQQLCVSHGADGASHVAFIGSAADQAPAIVRIAVDGSTTEVVRRAAMPELPPELISHAQPMRLRARDGGDLFAYYYPPRNPRVSAPAGGAPPLIVTTHGGPTAAAGRGLNLRVQYFTSRGFAVVDVDYRGSAGYGRVYRDVLKGRWGLLDVQDCEDVVSWLVRERLADPERVAIRGGSAGGYTTLCALTSSSVFRAGASHYGIGDLRALARDTHKFESRYLDSLIGGEQALDERSPIHHVDRCRCPVIFFQGADDRVVPPAQSREMAEALRRKGLPVAYVEFAGEGHGFRQAAHIEQALASEYAFYCRVFDLHPEQPLHNVEIANL